MRGGGRVIRDEFSAQPAHFACLFRILLEVWSLRGKIEMFAQWH